MPQHTQGTPYGSLDTDVKLQLGSDKVKDEETDTEPESVCCNNPALTVLCSEGLSGEDCQTQQQRSPTHFVALRLLSPPLQDLVKKLQNEFCYNAQICTGRSQTWCRRLCYPPQKLHISLSVLALSQHEVPQMCGLLDQWYIAASQMFVSTSEWSVQFPSINSFSGNVIYLEPDAVSRHVLLEPMAASLSQFLMAKQTLFGAGAVKGCCRIPHATFLKIPPMRPREPKQPEGFMFTHIPHAAWQRLLLHNIGKVPLHTVQLLDMRQQSANEPGYFKVVWQAPLPMPQ